MEEKVMGNTICESLESARSIIFSAEITSLMKERTRAIKSAQ